MLSSSISADPTKPVSTQFEEDQTPTDAQETTDAPETTDKEEKETVDIKEVDDEVEDKDGKETVDIKEEDAEGEDKDVEMPTLKVNENDATFKKEPTPNSKLPPFPKQGWESPTQVSSFDIIFSDFMNKIRKKLPDSIEIMRFGSYAKFFT